MIWVMMAVGLLQRLKSHAQIARSFLLVGGGLHQPRGRGVPQGVSDNPICIIPQYVVDEVAECTLRIRWLAIVFNDVLGAVGVPSAHMGQQAGRKLNGWRALVVALRLRPPMRGKIHRLLGRCMAALSP
ncbi:hypothetical protein BTE77_08305 [Ensifer adhaerens]|nr:hypothetical protein BTE77_08305 [Ensifer adhaerens]